MPISARGGFRYCLNFLVVVCSIQTAVLAQDRYEDFMLVDSTHGDLSAFGVKDSGEIRHYKRPVRLKVDHAKYVLTYRPNVYADEGYPEDKTIVICNELDSISLLYEGNSRSEIDIIVVAEINYGVDFPSLYFPVACPVDTLIIKDQSNAVLGPLYCSRDTKNIVFENSKHEKVIIYAEGVNVIIRNSTIGELNIAQPKSVSLNNSKVSGLNIKDENLRIEVNAPAEFYYSGATIWRRIGGESRSLNIYGGDSRENLIIEDYEVEDVDLQCHNDSILISNVTIKTGLTDRSTSQTPLLFRDIKIEAKQVRLHNNGVLLLKSFNEGKLSANVTEVDDDATLSFNEAVLNSMTAAGLSNRNSAVFDFLRVKEFEYSTDLGFQIRSLLQKWLSNYGRSPGRVLLASLLAIFCFGLVIRLFRVDKMNKLYPIDASMGILNESTGPARILYASMVYSFVLFCSVSFSFKSWKVRNYMSWILVFYYAIGLFMLVYLVQTVFSLV